MARRTICVVCQKYLVRILGKFGTFFEHKTPGDGGLFLVWEHSFGGILDSHDMILCYYWWERKRSFGLTWKNFALLLLGTVPSVRETLCKGNSIHMNSMKKVKEFQAILRMTDILTDVLQWWSVKNYICDHIQKTKIFT